MEGIFREAAFCQLSVVVTIHKELHVFSQGLHSSRKTSGPACQAFQIMSQICIDRFNGVGFLLICPHFIRSTIIQRVIGRKRITVVLFCLWSTFQAGLQGLRCPFCHHIPTQDTASIPINDSQDVDFVFFLPIKVYNSSNSAFLTLPGMGAWGSLAVCWLTQLATLCGLTFRTRPIEP